jgi:hypothetical protein
MTTTQQALDYIKNSGGMVKKDIFMDDLEPLGFNLLRELLADNKVGIGTDKGKVVIVLNELN